MEANLKSKPKVDGPLLRVISFNIADVAREKLTDIAHQIQADVLCITGVSRGAYDILNTSLHGFSSFQVFIAEGNTKGTVIYCNKKTVAISEDETPYYFDYEGVKGRILGTGIYHKRTKMTFNILTAELEFNNEEARQLQLDTLEKVIADMDNYILLGDLGDLPYKIHDVWIKLGCPSRAKYTVDGHHNRFCIDDRCHRFTRIYFKSRCLNPKAISLLGTVSPVGPNYGVETVFQIKKSGSLSQN